LSVDINTAKIMCGKNVEKDMLTYLSEVEHKEAFTRVHQRLRLTETPTRKTRESATELEKRVDRLERMVNIIAGINPEAVRRADEILKSLGVGKLSEKSFIEKLRLIDEKQQAKEREEYRKLIEANNNNNH